jgi:hypothetical protein
MTYRHSKARSSIAGRTVKCDAAAPVIDTMRFIRAMPTDLRNVKRRLFVLNGTPLMDTGAPLHGGATGAGAGAGGAGVTTVVVLVGGLVAATTAPPTTAPTTKPAAPSPLSQCSCAGGVARRWRVGAALRRLLAAALPVRCRVLTAALPVRYRILTTALSSRRGLLPARQATGLRGLPLRRRRLAASPCSG